MVTATYIKQITIMTNWSTEELKHLKEMTNHKVVYDGYEFIWMHRLDGEWNRHYVNNFEDYNKPMSWIYSHVYRWDKEYRKRHAKYLDDMRMQLDIDIRIREISKEANIKTKQKVLEVIYLRPSISNKEISTILDVTVRSVERHRK
tara:strand:+ start:1312 stop:1749 length:438 start_codon:yes stop_codon:yes gene_type:complete